VPQLPRPNGLGCFKERSENREIGADFIAGHPPNNKAEFQLLEIVLPLQLAIDRNENVKTAFGVG
jgi:hypothetical protein